MKKFSILLCLITVLIVWWTHPIKSQELVGPDHSAAGKLVTFEIVPEQKADWTITPEKGMEESFKIDSSSSRIYFAESKEGKFTIVAAIVLGGHPKLLSKAFSNGKKDDDVTPPPPPPPPSTLEEWIAVQYPVLVKSAQKDTQLQLIIQCFDGTIQKIDDGVIRSSPNAQTQLQICMTATLVMSSQTAIDDWHEFLAGLSTQMENELGSDVNSLDAIKVVYEKVSKGLKAQMISNTPSATRNSIPAYEDCPNCVRTPATRTFRWRR